MFSERTPEVHWTFSELPVNCISGPLNEFCKSSPEVQWTPGELGKRTLKFTELVIWGSLKLNGALVNMSVNCQWTSGHPICAIMWQSVSFHKHTKVISSYVISSCDWGRYCLLFTSKIDFRKQLWKKRNSGCTFMRREQYKQTTKKLVDCGQNVEKKSTVR